MLEVALTLDAVRVLLDPPSLPPVLSRIVAAGGGVASADHPHALPGGGPFSGSAVEVSRCGGAGWFPGRRGKGWWAARVRCRPARSGRGASHRPGVRPGAGQTSAGYRGAGTSPGATAEGCGARCCRSPGAGTAGPVNPNAASILAHARVKNSAAAGSSR